MKRLLVLQLWLSLSASVVFAQHDSLAVRKAKWEKAKIARGVTLKQHSFAGNLFASTQYISILEIKKRRHHTFQLAYKPTKLVVTSQFGKEANALAALNGSFFDVKNGGSVDYLRAGGVIISENRPDKDSTRAHHQKAAFVLTKGKLSIAVWDGTPDWEKHLTGDDVLLTGPLLIRHNRYAELDTAAFNRLRHPRTAIAFIKNKIFLVAVDGRSDNAAGMSLFELANVFKWLGAYEAINLDGGGSTTLWVDGKKRKGVVNHPSDNKKWDHEGERKVANALLLLKR
ncbi:phosphodiester glycosidase family protein [Hufsiella ginkgonis]|uniref:Phosphodiester glycosidase family protein n=1 Tax=Hufsiella ginkgonis TaxID=2695274 RepID=A0A7K1Y400_9SPHI|nr:phosphodiester glycosidase family protein [Hufsiella ginkgonis]MXV17597.1 phosphodiester glycosidase family protein [Hufsiella ginkgonis]